MTIHLIPTMMGRYCFSPATAFFAAQDEETGKRLFLGGSRNNNTYSPVE